MLTVRTLPASDWSRLDGIDGPLPDLNPDVSRVLVVEDADGQIIGRWLLLIVPMAEGIWIHPDHQKRGVVAAKLLKAMGAALAEFGSDVAVTFAASEDVAGYLNRLGATPLTGTGYVLPFRR
jgi:hypothetical protein